MSNSHLPFTYYSMINLLLLLLLPTLTLCSPALTPTPSNSIINRYDNRTVVVNLRTTDRKTLIFEGRLYQRSADPEYFFTDIPDRPTIRLAHIRYGTANANCHLITMGYNVGLGSFSRVFRHTKNPVRFDPPLEHVTGLYCEDSERKKMAEWDGWGGGVGGAFGEGK